MRYCKYLAVREELCRFAVRKERVNFHLTVEQKTIKPRRHMLKEKKIEPGLFGQDHKNSNRDYTQERYWGKNQFNSSFPASLVAYMSYKGIDPVYLKTDADNKVVHTSITPSDLFRINPMAPNAFYNFEAGYVGFEKFYTGEREKIDLVMVDSATNESLIGLEIKLTAIPDNTTKSLHEDEYSSEIVVRPPTINFLACSLCSCFLGTDGRNKLRELLGTVPQINHWEEIGAVLPHYGKILNAVLNVSRYLQKEQTPLIIQPVWKTKNGSAILADDCLDVFVWSNLSVIQMCCLQEADKSKINRLMRTIIWLYLMLFDYAVYEQFDYKRIVRLHSYNIANDKAFAISGIQSHALLRSPQLAHPRIGKREIKNIILGGGQNFLSPERRFDAVIVYSPELFD